jgi:hypothetical protein
MSNIRKQRPAGSMSAGVTVQTDAVQQPAAKSNWELLREKLKRKESDSSSVEPVMIKKKKTRRDDISTAVAAVESLKQNELKYRIDPASEDDPFLDKSKYVAMVKWRKTIYSKILKFHVITGL